ncbi:hypothetical protein LBMAG53_24610 [Planctomycetota bacterium]|nr:hypothetical protein LBMAG53_24610 [Planctomycetota bacterium]
MRSARIWWTVGLVLIPVVILAGISAQRLVSFPDADVPDAFAWYLSSGNRQECLEGVVFPIESAEILEKIHGPKFWLAKPEDRARSIEDAADWRATRRSGDGGLRYAYLGTIAVDRPRAGVIQITLEKDRKILSNPGKVGFCGNGRYRSVQLRQNPFAWWPGQTRWCLFDEIQM